MVRERCKFSYKHMMIVYSLGVAALLLTIALSAYIFVYVFKMSTQAKCLWRCVQFCNAIRWKMKRIRLELRPCWYLLINTFSFPLHWIVRSPIKLNWEQARTSERDVKSKSAICVHIRMHCMDLDIEESSGVFLFSS